MTKSVRFVCHVVGFLVPAMFTMSVVVSADPPPLRSADLQDGGARPALVPAGHPMVDDLRLMPRVGEIPAWLSPGQRGGAIEIPALSPLANGPFVNFESPQVKPLALSPDGNTLYAVNTPNNTVLAIDATGALIVLQEIPVGLEPVSVAVQPGTAGNIIWVANFISDNISVVNVEEGRVVDVIDVGDEPVNILFAPGGRWAFVVIQGIGPGDVSQLNPENPQLGNVVVVEAGTNEVVSTTFLDMHTPRAAVYDGFRRQLVVAALHSGNNTTVVGKPVTIETTDPIPANPNACETACNCDCQRLSSLEILRDFPVTADLFAATPGLGVWPDPHVDPDFPASPPVHRIINDVGTPGGWQAIVDAVSDDDGAPDPAIVTELEDFWGITNGLDILAAVIADAKDTTDHDLVVLDVGAPSDVAGLPILSYVGDVGTTLTGMGIDPISHKIFVSDMSARNVVRHVENLRGHIVDHRVVMLVDPANTLTAAPVDLHSDVPNFNDVASVNVVAKQNSLANPLDIVFGREGGVGFVVSLSADRVGSLASDTGRVVGRVDVGRAPRGIAYDDLHGRLLVLNRTDQSISVVDVSDPAQMEVEETFALFNPEPMEIQIGRNFLYSSRLTNNGASACVTCHIDANLDHLAWDLGNPAGELQPGPPNVLQSNHPIKGPMVTQSFKGLRNHEPLHWRGDKTVFQDFNEAFPNLLGTSAELSDEDMNAFTAFVNTIDYPPNPFYERNNTLSQFSRAETGAAFYITNCDACHRVVGDATTVDGHDGAFKGADFDPPVEGDVGMNLQGLLAQLQLIPQMRELHKKFQDDRFTGFGLIHDGREEREETIHPMAAFLDEFFPEENTGIGPQEQLDMIAFLNAFPSNVMNVVGWQVIYSGGSEDQPSAQTVADINLMISQFGKEPSHCDVVAKGVLSGVQRGFVLVANDPGILFETDNGLALTLDGLLDSLDEGELIVFTAVPPGSGRRIGVDQDGDCLSNGQDAQPQTNNAGDSNFDGVVDVADFVALFNCSLLDGSLPLACRVFDADCTGVLDDVDFDAFVTLFGGSSDDCNSNGANDLLDILSGVSVDVNSSGVPDECETAEPPLSLDPILKNRYITFTPNNDTPVAFHVELTSGPGVSGKLGWVGAPDGEGISRVSETPYFSGGWPANVDVGDCEIVPGATYELRASIDGLSLTAPAAVDTARVPAPWWWGDSVGLFIAGNWTGPNGVVNFNDISATVRGFQELDDAPSVPRLDLDGEVPNKLINFNDISRVVQAFQGNRYPFVDPSNCP